MDRLIYVAMTGAQQLLEQQAGRPNNLANAQRPGFKAEMTAFRVGTAGRRRGPSDARLRGRPARPVRTLRRARLQATGRDLDVAIEGDGFLAVQALDGSEAYTRNGSFDISPDGELRTRSGLTGARRRRPDHRSAGFESRSAATAPSPRSTRVRQANTVTIVGRLKLVKLAEGRPHARRRRPVPYWQRASAADADPAVVVTAGALEVEQRQRGRRDGRDDQPRAHVRDCR